MDDLIRAVVETTAQRAAASQMGHADLHERAVARQAKALEALRSAVQRAHDLVRQQRSELLDAGLISEEEYAALAAEQGAVARLQGYDALRAENVRLRKWAMKLIDVATESEQEMQRALARVHAEVAAVREEAGDVASAKREG